MAPRDHDAAPGLADRVSLSKGCYVGQETLAKLATYDGVKQQLRRWCWQPPSGFAEQALGAGQTLFNAAGERAGAITSVLQLPPAAGGLWIGLALVRRSALDEPLLNSGEQTVLELSLPDTFVVPPRGPGQSAGQSQS
jgi:folate-binding Fe-S cluster repair protein YgfZ